MNSKQAMQRGALGAALAVTVALAMPGPAQAAPARQSESIVVDAATQPSDGATGVRVAPGGTVVLVGANGTWTCYPSFSAVGTGGHKKSIKGVLQAPRARLCALIGRIGRGSWQALTSRGLTSSGGGELFLAANDIPAPQCEMSPDTGCYDENRGAIEVTIEVQ